MINEIVDALPLSDSGGADVTRQIEKLASPATALGLVSLLVFGWAATGMMASLRAGLEVAMRVERGRPAVRGKLVDVILHRRSRGARARRRRSLNLATQVLIDWVERPLDRLGLDGGLLEQGSATASRCCSPPASCSCSTASCRPGGSSSATRSPARS